MLKYLNPRPFLLQEKGTGVEVFGLIPRRLRRVDISSFEIDTSLLCLEDIHFAGQRYRFQYNNPISSFRFRNVTIIATVYNMNLVISLFAYFPMTFFEEVR